MENKEYMKTSIRLKDNDMYNLSVIENYLFEISNKKGIEIDNSITGLIRQALYMSAYVIENKIL